MGWVMNLELGRLELRDARGNVVGVWAIDNDPRRLDGLPDDALVGASPPAEVVAAFQRAMQGDPNARDDVARQLTTYNQRLSLWETERERTRGEQGAAQTVGQARGTSQTLQGEGALNMDARTRSAYTGLAEGRLRAQDDQHALGIRQQQLQQRWARAFPGTPFPTVAQEVRGGMGGAAVPTGNGNQGSPLAGGQADGPTGALGLSADEITAYGGQEAVGQAGLLQAWKHALDRIELQLGQVEKEQERGDTYGKAQRGVDDARQNYEVAKQLRQQQIVERMDPRRNQRSVGGQTITTDMEQPAYVTMTTVDGQPEQVAVELIDAWQATQKAERARRDVLQQHRPKDWWAEEQERQRKRREGSTFGPRNGDPNAPLTYAGGGVVSGAMYGGAQVPGGGLAATQTQAQAQAQVTEHPDVGQGFMEIARWEQEQMQALTQQRAEVEQRRTLALAALAEKKARLDAEFTQAEAMGRRG